MTTLTTSSRPCCSPSYGAKGKAVFNPQCAAMADAATKRVYVFRENARVVRNKQNDVQVSRMRDGRVLEAQPVCVPRVPACHTETSVFALLL